MLTNDKRITILCGHYGTGKTNVAVNTGSCQFGCTVFGAEVGVYDVKVCDHDPFPLCSEMQRVVHGNVGFAGAVVSGKKRQSFMIHN